MINYYDMDTRDVQREAYRTLARGGAENRANGHCCVNLPIGSDRGRSKRLACRHCSNIDAHGGTKHERKKRDTSYMCNICDVPLHNDCFNAYHRTNNIQLFDDNLQIPSVITSNSAKKQKRSS